jgi:selenocysteine-specific elongation factor
VAATALGAVEAVACSGVIGAGLDDLRAALDRLLARLPVPDPGAPVRLWVDRAFTVRGSGTVVTGTLAAGSIEVGDELQLAPGYRRAVVRAIQSLGRACSRVSGTARVAANLRGVRLDEVRRGSALLTPDRWLQTGVVDVRLHCRAVRLPRQLTLHLGSAAVPSTVRPFGTDLARLVLTRPLPLRIGDRGVLRDPGQRQVVAGLTVLDVCPPPAHPPRRRGGPGGGSVHDGRCTGRRGGAAAARPGAGGAAARDGRRVACAAGGRRLGGRPGTVGRAAARAGRGGRSACRRASAGGRPDGRGGPQAPRPARPAAGDGAGHRPADRPGRAGDRRRGAGAARPAAGGGVLDELAAAPFAAPEAYRLAELGLGSRELAAAVRVAALTRLADGVYLLPDAPAVAARLLAALPEPFTLSAARQALGTSRRVAVPLLELLDARGVTERLPDSRRRLRRGPTPLD